VSERGVSMQAASWALMAFWAMVTIGRLLFAALSTKVSVRTIYIVLPFLLAIAFRIVSRVRTEVGGLFAFGIAGLGCSAFFPLSISLAGDEFPALSSVMSGELIAFYQLGYGVAAFGTGPLRNLAACGASLGTWAKTCEVSTSSVRRIGAWRWARGSSGRSKRGYGSRIASWQQRRDIPSTRS